MNKEDFNIIIIKDNVFDYDVDEIAKSFKSNMPFEELMEAIDNNSETISQLRALIMIRMTEKGYITMDGDNVVINQNVIQYGED